MKTCCIRWLRSAAALAGPAVIGRTLCTRHATCGRRRVASTGPLPGSHRTGSFAPNSWGGWRVAGVWPALGPRRPARCLPRRLMLEGTPARSMAARSLHDQPHCQRAGRPRSQGGHLVAIAALAAVVAVLPRTANAHHVTPEEVIQSLINTGARQKFDITAAERSA